MERIRKLPFILGCIAAMAVGIANYGAGSDNQTTFLRMAVVMTIFFIIGVYIRNTVLSIDEQVKEKERQRLLEEEQRIREEHEERRAEEEAAKLQAGGKGHNVDLVAEDRMEEFQPMTVSRVISSKVKE
jgi:hypothetical protein